MAKDKEEIQRNYGDFVYIPNIIFKSIGYDFLGSSKPLWQEYLQRAYFMFALGCHSYVVFFMMLRIFQWDTLAGDAENIVRYGELLFLIINTETKLFTFLYYRHRIRDLNRKLMEIFPQTDPERRKYRVNEFYLPRIIRCGLFYFFSVFILIVFAPLVQSTCIFLYQCYSLGYAEARFPYMRAYPMRLSFDTNNPTNYVIVQIVEFACSHFFNNFNIGTDVWMMCLSSQICLHFSNLVRQLAHYSPNRDRAATDCEFLISVVRKHLYVLSLHKELNEVFGMLLAYNLFTTAGTLCCAAFYTIVQGLNLNAFSFLLYFISCAAQFYTVCHYGQWMMDLSQDISQSAYTQNWYDGSQVYQKLLLFIMMNTCKPAVLSAKNIIIISLLTFQNMMNITYRYFAIIRRLLGK